MLNSATPNLQASLADALLTSGPWLLIDARNEAVGFATSADEARRAVERGRAATWAARPREGVTALDLDMPEALAALVADQITAWCLTRGLWHLVRPSGRPGHLHLWIIPRGWAGLLAELLADLRRELRLSGSQLDQRDASYIRPLAAPHRSGAEAPAPLTAEHLAVLEGELHHTPPPPRRARATTKRSAQKPAHVAGRRASARATRKPIPDETGDRSYDEWMLTLTAYNQGKSADEAWQLVAARDGHSAARGRRWWQAQMWAKIRPAEGTGALVDASRHCLPAILARLALLPSLHQRAAGSVDAVLWVLGELVADATQPVPVSQRDIEGRTGLTRPTVAAALARAVTAGIIERHHAARPSEADSWSWGPSMAVGRGVLLPPCLTPAASRWLHTLPPHSLTTLAQHLTAQPLTHPATLAAALAITQDPQGVQPVECPAWPRIRAERDAWHHAVRETRTRYEAQWEADRDRARRAERARALAWLHNQCRTARLTHPAPAHQPALPSLAPATACEIPGRHRLTTAAAHAHVLRPAHQATTARLGYAYRGPDPDEGGGRAAPSTTQAPAQSHR